jgi:hypothetical protein
MVEKTDGRVEPFDVEKMVRSITAVRVPTSIAEEIAAAIPQKDRKSREIRKLVYEELKVRNPRAARLYCNTLCLKAIRDLEVPEGSAQLTLKNLVRLSLKPGDQVEVGRTPKLRLLRATWGAHSHRNMRLSQPDMDGLGAEINSKIPVRRV